MSRCKNRSNWQSDKYDRFKYRHPRAAAVQRRTRRWVASGKIIKPNKCSKCGRTDKPIQAHHEDYEKPFEIMWLCTGCHGDIHNREKFGDIRNEALRKEKQHQKYLEKKIRDYHADPLGIGKKK